MSLPKKSILVIDDEAVIRSLLEARLRQAGFESRGAGTVAEALDSIKKAPPEMVLLDLLLPDGDGMDLLVKIKQAHPKLPVIVLTGIGMDEDLQKEASAKGAAAYLSKDATVDHLLMHIGRHLLD
jgi:DNA-binding NtrC family response regulator